MRSAFSLYPKHGLGVVILTNLLGASPEEFIDAVAISFVPEMGFSSCRKKMTAPNVR